MPTFQDASVGVTADPIAKILGVQAPPPAPPTANPTLNNAPTVSSTPGPGAIVQLDATGHISSSVIPRIGRGAATVSWPGGATLSSGTTVSHGLPTTPTVAVATMGPIDSGVSVICVVQIVNMGSTTFDVYAQTIDGSTPAAASSVTVYWLALT